MQKKIIVIDHFINNAHINKCSEVIFPVNSETKLVSRLRNSLFSMILNASSAIFRLWPRLTDFNSPYGRSRTDWDLYWEKHLIRDMLRFRIVLYPRPRLGKMVNRALFLIYRSSLESSSLSHVFTRLFALRNRLKIESMRYLRSSIISDCLTLVLLTSEIPNYRAMLSERT